VPGWFEGLVESITNQPEAFRVDWSFKGTRHFISNHEALAPYRA
jgi:hypothetical protein